MAAILLEKLPEKFHPEQNTPHRDGLDHTPRRRARNEKGDIKEEDLVFNPDVTGKSPMDEIRIFGRKEKYKTRKAKDKTLKRKPAYRRGQNGPEAEEEIILYTDGSSTKNGAENSIGGAGIWHEEDSLFNRSIRIPGKGVTNNEAELTAIMEAVKMNCTAKMTIRSDSKMVLDGIIKNHKNWEDNDWLDIENRKKWEELLYRLRQRRGPTVFRWVKGHDKEEGNEMADKLAEEGTRKVQEDVITYFKDKKFTVRGARLSEMTQKKAYRLIVRKKKRTKNERRDVNLINTKDEIERLSGYRPSTKQLWKGMRNEDIRSKVNDLLWTMMHERIRCGKYFQNIPGWEEKQYCQCGEVETIDHILLECQMGRNQEVWKIAKETWVKTSPKGTPWLEPNGSLIRGLGSMKYPKEDGEEEREEMKEKKKQRINTQRYRIIVSEAVWTIWNMRNKRIFQDIGPNETKIANEWIELIRRKVEIDFLIIMRGSFKTRKRKLEDYRALWSNHEEIVKVKEENGKYGLIINF